MAKKILIVDDEVHIRDIIRFRMEVEGFEILEANNGRNAIEVLTKEQPNIIVLDVMMPEMDGWEVCRFVRSQPDISKTPILMLTAKTEIRDKIHGMQAGANDYLTKPFSPNELVVRVQKLLQAAESH